MTLIQREKEESRNREQNQMEIFENESELSPNNEPELSPNID